MDPPLSYGFYLGDEAPDVAKIEHLGDYSSLVLPHVAVREGDAITQCPSQRSNEEVVLAIVSILVAFIESLH